MKNSLLIKILKIVSGISVFILVVLIAIQMLFGKTIKEFVVNTINSQVTTKIIVSGGIDFSVFSNFPYVSVELNKVRVKDTFGSEADLLYAEKVSVLINLWNLFNGTNTISRISIQDGSLSVKVNKSGKANYLIFKDAANGPSRSIHITRLLLRKIELDYDDKYNAQHYTGVLKDIKLSGDFASTQFDLKLQGAFFARHILINNTDYATNKDLEFDGGIRIDMNTGEYKINKTTLSVNSSAFNISGLVKNQTQNMQLDLFITGAKSGIADIGSILPNAYQHYLSDINTDGTISFTGTIKGNLSRKENPTVQFIFDVNDANINHKSSKQQVEDVHFKAVFSNGTKKTWSDSKLVINRGKASFGAGPVQFDLMINRLSNPIIQLNLNGTFRMGAITALIDNAELKQIDGVITVNNLRYSGTIKEMQTSNALMQSEGTITLKDIVYVNNSLSVKQLEGTIEFNDDIIGINRLSAELNGSQIILSGEVNHLLPTVIHVLKNPHHYVPNSYFVNVNIETGPITYETIATGSSDQAKQNDTSKMMQRLLRSAAGLIKLKSQSISYNKLLLTSIQSDITISNSQLYVANFKLNTLKGSVSGSGRIDLSRQDVVDLNASVTLQEIDIKDVFHSFENFNQYVLTDKNINGILNTTFTCKAIWKDGIFISDQFQSVADITITKGELIDFKPIYALSKYVKIDELKHIQFSKLTNQITIKNETITIPNTVIYTSALNLELSGTHTFNNYVDYAIKLNLLKILSNKFKSDSSFDPDATERDASGLINLYLTVKGPADNPEVTYDKRTVKQVIRENMKKEQEVLKDVLRNEFSGHKQTIEEIKDWEPPTEYELIDFEADTMPN